MSSMSSMTNEIMLDYIIPKLNKIYPISYGFDVLRKGPIRPSFNLINKLRNYIREVFSIDEADLIEMLNLISGHVSVELVLEKSILHENNRMYTGISLQVNNIFYYLHINILPC